MASAATIAVFLLCCFVTASTGSRDDCVYAVTGSSFTVPLGYKLKQSDSLRWLKDTSLIFYRRNKKVISGKNDDVDSTGSLKLTQLTKDKSGRYTPEIHSAEGITVGGNLPSAHLCVIDRVQKPNVTMTCTDDKTKVSFTCNVGQNENNFMIEWFMDDKKLAEKKMTLTRVAKDVLNARFSCKASNPVSAEVSLHVKQDCHEFFFRDTVFGITICVFVGTGGGIFLVLILNAIICCIKIRQKKHIELNELYLQWTDQEQEQPHYYEHRYQQQPAVNTKKVAENSSIPQPGTWAHCGLKRDSRK